MTKNKGRNDKISNTSKLSLGGSAVGFNQVAVKKEKRLFRPERELNLKGKICPYTFIESMLALEEMKTGEILRIIVDYPPSVGDVPRSLKNEGYEVLEVAPVNDTDWAIWVRNIELK